jgi:hypothetical protein
MSTVGSPAGSSPHTNDGVATNASRRPAGARGLPECSPPAGPGLRSARLGEEGEARSMAGRSRVCDSMGVVMLRRRWWCSPCAALVAVRGSRLGLHQANAHGGDGRMVSLGASSP